MVAVYAFTLKLNSFNFVIRRDLNMNDLENLCLEIQKPCSKPFLLVSWYRPPCSSAELFSHYETLIAKLDSLDLEYYLMGDFNCNMASAHFDSNTRLLCEISDIYGLQQLITEPSRITESSSSLMDVIFTNCIEVVRIWKDFVQINLWQRRRQRLVPKPVPESLQPPLGQILHVRCLVSSQASL